MFPSWLEVASEWLIGVQVASTHWHWQSFKRSNFDVKIMSPLAISKLKKVTRAGPGKILLMCNHVHTWSSSFPTPECHLSQSDRLAVVATRNPFRVNCRDIWHSDSDRNLGCMRCIHILNQSSKWQVSSMLKQNDRTKLAEPTRVTCDMWHVLQSHSYWLRHNLRHGSNTESIAFFDHRHFPLHCSQWVNVQRTLMT